MRIVLILAAFTLSACQVTLASSNVAFSTSTPSYTTSGDDEFVRCPNRPSKQVRAGFEDSLCYD